MFWRLTAAIIALTVLHDPKDPARDGIGTASLSTTATARAITAYCLEKSVQCQEVVHHTATVLPALTAALPSRIETSLPAPPVVSTNYPLPPQRPFLGSSGASPTGSREEPRTHAHGTAIPRHPPRQKML
jgi:hypothetical protein